MRKELVHVSRFLSLALRHHPQRVGLALDEAGWASVTELLEKSVGAGVDLTKPILLEIVATNEKRRFELSADGTRIRASQGHGVWLVDTVPPRYLSIPASAESPPSRRSAKGRTNDIVVFSIVRDSACAECGSELYKGAFLRMEGDRPLCMTCADLDRLVFLASGNAALTRRASKHSPLRAVVVRFSRSRKRYERQGILVDEAALERAEKECLADADARELARERAAERRARQDAEYVTAFARRVGELLPGCPPDEQEAIAHHACRKYSGRIGRSAAARELEASAVELAVRAHVRHAHTSYDELLARGRDRLEARAEIAGQVERVVDRWRSHGGS